MVNRNRDYGLDWERELVNTFKRFDQNARRNPNSGAFGTIIGSATLQGDVPFSVDGLKFIIEAKAGYGGHKSMTFKREWMDEVVDIAENQTPKKIPLVALKMKGGRTDSSKLIVMTLKDFVKVLETIEGLLDDLEEANNFILSVKDSVNITPYLNGDFKNDK